MSNSDNNTSESIANEPTQQDTNKPETPITPQKPIFVPQPEKRDIQVSDKIIQKVVSQKKQTASVKTAKEQQKQKTDMTTP